MDPIVESPVSRATNNLPGIVSCRWRFARFRGRANQANHEWGHRDGRQKSALDAIVRRRRRGMFETECEFWFKIASLENSIRERKPGWPIPKRPKISKKHCARGPKSTSESCPGCGSFWKSARACPRFGWRTSGLSARADDPRRRRQVRRNWRAKKFNDGQTHEGLFERGQTGQARRLPYPRSTKARWYLDASPLV